MTKTARKLIPVKVLAWRITHMRDWREERNLTLEEVVEALSRLDPPITRTYNSLSRYENGLQEPGAKTLEGIAKVLGIDIDTMLNYSPANHQQRLLQLLGSAIKQA